MCRRFIYNAVVPKKILVVDDDPALLDLLTIHLRDAGHEVITAAAGDEALDNIRRAMPDVVLLDIMLPGKHGYAVCQAIRADPKFAGIKIIIMSAKSFAADIKNALALGADDYLVKPFEPSALLDAIDRLAGTR